MDSNSPFDANDVKQAMILSELSYQKLQNNNNIRIFSKKDGTPIGIVKKEKDKLFICFRGTTSYEEAINDLNIKPASITSSDEDPIHVHKGFHDLYKDCEKSMNKAITGLSTNSEIKEMIFTGHSAGAALSQVASLNHKLQNPDTNVKNITFGGPRVFFKNGAQKYNKHLGSNTLLVQQKRDPVVHLPPPPLFSHAGYHRIKMSVTDKSLDTHQPPAYLNICDNITDRALQATHAKAIEIERRMHLSLEKKRLGKAIRKDRSERIKKALQEASKLNIKDSLSIILDGSKRNLYRKVQKNINSKSRSR
ncbi:MAG: lipase family protein [Rickettsiales bacterium]|jgi:hypothetical protein|nr:lipase family protein [Rickettsiales bacterium]